jgi:hypothetical protein
MSVNYSQLAYHQPTTTNMNDVLEGIRNWWIVIFPSTSWRLKYQELSYNVTSPDCVFSSEARYHILTGKKIVKYTIRGSCGSQYEEYDLWNVTPCRSTGIHRRRSQHLWKFIEKLVQGVTTKGSTLRITRFREQYSQEISISEVWSTWPILDIRINYCNLFT